MGESTTIIIIIVLLMVIGFSFYAYLKAENLKKDKEMLEEYEDVQLTLTASNIPELLCSTGQDIDNNCYDLLKIQALMKVMESNNPEALFYYTDYFGKSVISISVIYPSQPARNYRIFNNTDGGNYSAKSIPTIIYDPVERKNYFGLINIGRQ